MPSAETLAPFLTSDPNDFAALRLTCFNIINAWINAGGEPWDDPVHDFFLIDAQGDDVGHWGGERATEEAEFFRDFYPVFIEARDALPGAAGTDLGHQ